MIRTPLCQKRDGRPHDLQSPPLKNCGDIMYVFSHTPAFLGGSKKMGNVSIVRGSAHRRCFFSVVVLVCSCPPPYLALPPSMLRWTQIGDTVDMRGPKGNLTYMGAGNFRIKRRDDRRVRYNTIFFFLPRGTTASRCIHSVTPKVPYYVLTDVFRVFRFRASIHPPLVSCVAYTMSHR